MIWLVVLIIVLALTGAGAIVAGTYVLVGLGWALVAGGAFAIAGAVILNTGLRSNG